jgi:phosphoglycerate-specific signal transduction histidine kinase
VKALIVISLALAATVAVAACGESKEDKAKKQVCSARDDIGKQVSSLKSLTPANLTADGVKSSLTAIQNDLKKISDAQGDLNDARKKQVQEANATFGSALTSIASELGQSLSAADARTQLVSSFQELSTAYQQSFAKLDCS